MLTHRRPHTTHCARLHAGRAALALLLVAATLTTVGCTHENPLSLQLEGNLLMVRLPGAGVGITGQCIPLAEQNFRPHGVMDLMVTNSYEFFPRIENKMVLQSQINGAGAQQLRLDSHTVTIEGAEMTLVANTSTGPLSGAPLQNSTWNMPFSIQVEPEQIAGTRFTLIPPNVGDELRARFEGQYTATQRIEVHVKVYGKMADGTEVQSNLLKYPVDICWGCLVSLPVAIEGVGVDPEQQYLTCSSKVVGLNFTPPCMPGNDEYVPCQFYCYMCDQDNSCDDKFCPDP